MPPRPGRPIHRLLFAAAAALVATAAWACFGTRLRIAVGPDPSQAFASYALGYYIEEKTGVAPEFVEISELSPALLAPGHIDLLLAPEPLAPGAAAVTRSAGEVPGIGAARFWLRRDVLEDLRFSTLDMALARTPALFGSAGYKSGLHSGGPARKAARKAVLDAP